jgi:hypothetical protein
VTDKERLEKIKEIDISPLCFYLNEMTNFDGKLLKGYWKWLIKQAELAEQLEEENRQLYKKNFELMKDNRDWYKQADSFQKENQRYKHALEFYADEEHYKEKLISEAQYDADGICISNDEYAPPIIYFDSGEKARQALEGDEN